ncbi:MAG: DUF975 family protein [Treponema sp.]|nr:DUF975 family protein [Treponema sp.]
MFNRRLYKKNALECLNGKRHIAALVSLVALGAMFLLDAGSMGKSIQLIGPQLTLILDARKMNFIVLAVLCFVLGTIGIAEAGFYLFAVTKPAEKISFSVFMDGFSQCIRGFLAFAWKWLWIVLWGFLCIIPGIVKYFAYSQLFYILGDYPELSVTQALSVSKEITKGHKADLFWMRLSFILWDIISIPTLFILQLWVRPYKQAAFALAYRSLMEKAIKAGAITAEDLGQNNIKEEF